MRETEQTIIHGDCLELLETMENPHKMVLITDPPYGINYDPKWLSEIHLAKGTKANSTDKKVINDEKPMDLNFLFQFPRRIIFGFPYVPDFGATGWLVWDKQPKIDERGIVTPVEVASTTLRKGYDIFRHMWGGYLRESGEKRFEHPTQKPLNLMRRLIEKFTQEDDVIFDPFAGSGSTLVAAKMQNRNAIGIEISEEYCNIANERLAATSRPLFSNQEAV